MMKGNNNIKNELIYIKKYFQLTTLFCDTDKLTSMTYLTLCWTHRKKVNEKTTNNL